MVLYLLDDKELYYLNPHLISGSSVTAVRIFTNIYGVGETVFIDGGNEAVGSIPAVRQSFTAGWAESLTSDLGHTITGKNGDGDFGVVLPSLASQSCVSETHPDLVVSLTDMPACTIEEMTPSGSDGAFS